MADKMMRIAGRGTDGSAKAIKTDMVGNIGVSVSDKLIRALSGYDVSLLLDFASDMPLVNAKDSHMTFAMSTSSIPTIENGGLLGKCLTVPANGYIKQNPLYKNYAGTAVSTHFPKVATYIGNISGCIGIATAYLSAVGTVTNARVQIRIYTDENGKPGVPWENTHHHYPMLTTDVAPSIKGSNISGAGFWGFPLIKPCVVNDEGAWLVMEYLDATGIDASNYIGWSYETSNTYTTGGKRATFDGSAWTVTSGQNHRFELYEPVFPDCDFTILTAVKATATGSGYLIHMPGLLNGDLKTPIMFGYLSNGFLFASIYDGILTDNTQDTTNRLNEWCVVALTLSKEKSRGKFVLYLNGEPAKQKRDTYFALDLGGMGAGGRSMHPVSQPLTIGNKITSRALITTNAFAGSLGFFAILRKELTPSEVKTINAIIRGR